MTPDLRRFAYALEPVRRERHWTLSTLQAELGRIQRELEEAEQLLEELRGQLRTAAGELTRGLSAQLDPVRHPRALRWLVQLRETIATAASRVESLRARRDQARTACLRQQQKVEVIERHHEEAMADFVQQEEARMASAADRDWLVRRGAVRAEGEER